MSQRATNILKDIAIGIGIGLLLATPIGLINAYASRSKAPSQQEKAKPSRMRSESAIAASSAPIVQC